MLLRAKTTFILAMAIAMLPAAVERIDAQSAPALRYEPGSTIKLEQLLGEVDKQFKRPTLSQTFVRYVIEGTDLGNSFEHAGRVYFLFGDTVGRLDHSFDTIATPDWNDPESGVRLDF